MNLFGLNSAGLSFKACPLSQIGQQHHCTALGPDLLPLQPRTGSSVPQETALSKRDENNYQELDSASLGK